MNDFCPRCGTEKGSFVKGFCVNCFVEKGEIISVPKEIEINACKNCGKIKVSNAWREQVGKSFSGILLPKIKVKELNAVKTEIDLIDSAEGKPVAKIRVSGTVDGEVLSFEREVLIKQNIGTCPDCSRLSGGYFEATIQLRFEKKSKELMGEKIKKVESLLLQLSKKEPLAKVVKIAFVTNGVDLIIGSKSAAKKVIRAMEKTSLQKAVFSTKLQGVDKNTGKTRHRYTYCLRF